MKKEFSPPPEEQSEVPSFRSKFAYGVGVAVWLALFGLAFYLKAL